MPKGYLELITGPMFCGKTTSLITRADAFFDKYEAFKLSFDSRYSKSSIVTHDGKKMPAKNVSKDKDFKIDFEKTQLVVIDEVQFFQAPNFQGDICQIIEDILEKGVHVICSGLDYSWKNKKFDITEKIRNKANKVTNLKASCSICGNPATKTFKKSGIENEIELGSDDLYEPRCEKHFFIFDHDEYENKTDIIIPIKNKFRSAKKFDLLSLPREKKNLSGIVPIVKK